MSDQREQTRRDAEWLLHHWPAFPRTRLQEVAVSVARSVPALLAKLEQAERERDEDEQEANATIRRWIESHDAVLTRALSAEARLASVPALVEALRGYVRIAQDLDEASRAALTVYEQSQPASREAKETRRVASGRVIPAPLVGPCDTCDGHGFQAGAHTEQVQPCPVCGGSGDMAEQSQEGNDENDE